MASKYFLFYLLIILIPLFHSPAFALPLHNPPSDPPRELLMEEKSRLGSRPPSCYNKCNQCHPCTAVQVPTLPSLDRVKPPPVSSVAVLEHDSSIGDSGYSNYKPLGWKCRCRNHYYNP